MCLMLSIAAAEAQKQWSLGECIEYGIENNINLQQGDVAIKQSDIDLNSALNQRLPSLNASLGADVYLGRSPSRDGSYVDNTQFTTSTGISASATLYNGSKINNTIKASRLNLQVSTEKLNAAKEDLSLQIVQLYMQILYNKELLEVAQKQVELSESYVEQSKILLDNGRASDGDYLESVATLSHDRLALIESQGELRLSLLTLSQALNLPDDAAFDIATPELSESDSQRLLPTSSLYDYALEHRPHIKSQELYLQSLGYQEKIARASGIPRISLSAGYNNSYFNDLSIGAVNASFKEQMRLNEREVVSLSISIPIFNQFATRNMKRSATLSTQNQDLALQNSKLLLRKEIEQASNNAVISEERYRASIEATRSAQRAFEYTEIKVREGRSNVFDFNESKTKLLYSESELVRAKYQYLFNVKILNLYAGQPLY